MVPVTLLGLLRALQSFGLTQFSYISLSLPLKSNGFIVGYVEH